MLNIDSSVYKEVFIYRGMVIAVWEPDCLSAQLYNAINEAFVCNVDACSSGESLDELVERSKVLIDAWHVDDQVFEKTKHLRDGYTYQLNSTDLKQEISKYLVAKGQLSIL